METIKNLIENSDVPKIHKTVAIAAIEAAFKHREKYSDDIKIIESTSGDRVNEIIFSNENVKFYSVRPKKDDDWSVKFPVRFIYLDEKNKWVRTGVVSTNIDIAYLIYLEKKYLGLNSQFAEFAMKMLDIKIEE